MGQHGSGMSEPAMTPQQAQMAKLKKMRPRGITILGAIILIVGLVNVLLGLYYTSLLGIVVSENFSTGLLTLLFGIFLMIAGGGLLTLRPWAWWLAMIMILVNLGWAIYDMTSTGNYRTQTILISVVLVILLIYLVAVRKVFMRRGAPAPA